MRRSRKVDRAEHRDEIQTVVRNAELFHEHGVSLPTRMIYMGHPEGTGPEMAAQVIKNLHVLEAINAQPITVIMNNPGGSVYDGLAIYDAVESCGCEITIIARGHVMSMGSIILQAAKMRVVGSTSTHLIHYGTDGVYDVHSKDFTRRARENERINAWMERLYLRRIREKQPKFPLSRLRKMLNFDTFLTAEQSVALGLADAIG